MAVTRILSLADAGSPPRPLPTSCLKIAGEWQDRILFHLLNESLDEGLNESPRREPRRGLTA